MALTYCGDATFVVCKDLFVASLLSLALDNLCKSGLKDHPVMTSNALYYKLVVFTFFFLYSQCASGNVYVLTSHRLLCDDFVN